MGSRFAGALNELEINARSGADQSLQACGCLFAELVFAVALRLVGLRSVEANQADCCAVRQLDRVAVCDRETSTRRARGLSPSC